MRRLLLLVAAALAGCSGPTQLASGQMVLQGVTSDGFAIVKDRGGAVIALSLADQSSQILFIDHGATVEVIGELVTIWDVNNQSDAVWSGSSGLQKVPHTVDKFDFIASSDGHVFSFHGPQITLQEVGGLPHDIADEFSQSFGFVGRHLVVLLGDTGRLTVFDTAAVMTARVLDQNSLCQLAGNNLNGERLLACGGGSAFLVPLDNTDPPTPIASDFGEGWIGADGSFVIFRNFDGVVARVDQKGKRTILKMDGVNCLQDHSPDDSAALFSESCSDVEVLDLANGKVTGMLDAEFGPIGASFTADSRFALLARPHDGTTVPDLIAVAPDVGSIETVATGVGSFLLPKGSRVVAGDHRADLRSLTDIELFDLGKSFSPTALAQGADPDFFLSPDGNDVLFTMPGQGLFRQPLSSGSPF